MTGYLHAEYAKSLEEFGYPYLLSKSQGWILDREIAGSAYRDAINCYPLFSCKNWSEIGEDLESLKENELVTLSVVTDPFGNYDIKHLHKYFNYKVIPFKEHFVVDTSRPLDSFVANHHRRYAHKALQNIQVEKCQEPMKFIHDWIKLYDVLVQRHNIQGISAFSEQSFIRQLQVPGILMFRAVHQEITVGITLWYIHSDVGYYHLGAYSDVGYQLRASFALFWSAIEYFSSYQLPWLSLGAGAGIQSDETDGLTRFKQGWATGTKTAYFCGHIFDEQKYKELVDIKDIPGTDYFPAYRKGEFG
ncbi:MAG: hypothetical protein MET45_10100 [Nostoc sp. LLA-1]|nr:hypothetical protein [Cyanocohniella sp. LLY]